MAWSRCMSSLKSGGGLNTLPITLKQSIIRTEPIYLQPANIFTVYRLNNTSYLPFSTAPSGYFATFFSIYSHAFDKNIKIISIEYNNTLYDNIVGPFILLSSSLYLDVNRKDIGIGELHCYPYGSNNWMDITVPNITMIINYISY